MKIYLYLLLWLLVLRKAHSGERPKLDEYLEGHSQSVQQRLNKNFHISDVQTDDQGTMAQATVQSPRQSDEIFKPSINIFRQSNKTFFLIDNSIFRGTMSKGLSMEAYGDFEHEKSTFFKSFEYHRTVFLAVSYKSNLHFHLLYENRTTPELMQQIWSPHTSDGHFFTNDDNLYFAASSNISDELGHVSFYKWMESYFDHIGEVKSTGATKIDSFPYKTSEILVVERQLAGIKLKSSVYEFKHDKARKIQELDTYNPFHMNIFFQKGVPYVLIYEESNRQQLFKWTGSEMVVVNRFQWEHNVEKSIVVYSNSIPLITHPQLDKILIFKAQNEDIRLYETRRYIENFSIILDINKGQNEKGNITFIAGLSEDYMINIYGMYFEAHAEMEREQGETLRNCFNNLEEKFYDRSGKVNQANVHSGLRKRQASSVPTFNATDITIQFNNLHAQLNRIKELINNPEKFPNEFVVDEKAIIQGSIKAKNVIGNHLRFNIINGKPWTPELWLQSTGKQVITGPVRIRNLKSQILVTNGPTASIFKDILRSNSSQKITGKFKIKNLYATDISTQRINNIVVDNIFKKYDSVAIKGVKSFKNISSKNSTISKINGKNAEDILGELRQAIKPAFASNVNIGKLEVEIVDKISWRDFEKTVFKVREDHTIFGNITAPKVTTKHLRARRINGADTNHLMTTSTDQIVNSTIKFDSIKALDITCKTVNGQSPANFVQLDQSVIVKGPVQIQDITVENNVELRSNDSELFLMKDNHIFGTNESDLQQRYLGKVLIHGNLYVNDISVLPNITMIIKGNKHRVEELNEYWTKAGNQTIPIHLEAQKGISVPNLEADYLNNISIDRFAVNNNKTQIKGPLIFQNVTVGRNVVLERTGTTVSFNLTKLASEGVKNDGKEYLIQGRKTFRNILVANRLTIPENLTLHTIQMSGNNRFERVTVGGDLIGNVNTDVINNINISRFKENLLPLDRPQNLTKMAFKKIAVENLHVEKINGINVTEFMTDLSNLLEKKHFKEIHVKGNITILKIQNVVTINNHDIHQLLEKRSQLDEDIDFLGDVKFSGKVSIQNLETNIINGIDFPNLTKRHFHNLSNQTVSGIYTFNTLKTEHLYANKINGENVEDLIDISLKKPHLISAPLGIILKNASFEKSIKAEILSPCDINKAMNNVRYPRTQEWNLVEIIGNVTFLDNRCDLMRIIEKSVKKSGKNIIRAPVHITGDIRAEQVRIENTLNNINLTELIDDVVLKDSDEEQVITGHKIFRQHITADYVTVTENADIPVVNNVYIPELYKRIIRKDEVSNITIFGHKTFFGGLQTDRLFSKNLGRVQSENIVNLANLSEIPNAVFDAIEVSNDLNVQFINNHNISKVFANRVLANSTKKQIVNSICYFDNLEVSGDLKASVINNIQMKDVVFDVGQQKINSFKQFNQNLTFLGDVNIGNINGINITEAYNNATLHGHIENINQSTTILNSVRLNGNIQALTINGYPIEQLNEIINTSANKVEERLISNMSEEIKIIIEDTLPKVKHMAKELMYIETSKNLQIGIQNAIDARVTKMKDYTLIHIIGEESHDKCNLPKGCKCPVQSTVEVTPYLSAALVLNETGQRIYSYDDDSITVHVKTCSISTDTLCRTDSIEEASIITWSSTSSKNFTGTNNIYPGFFRGYLSGVEFFTIGGVTYTIIALYYDPVADTHDLNCTLIRFSEDKTSASEIQHIQTHGAWTLHLLHTAQGVIMIIGNVADQPYTEIYRFNEKLQKFELLREVYFGCTKAVGVVLGTDSLIMLAKEDATLQVLRYHSGFNNYYYYQTFAFDEPVVGMSVFYVGDFGISDAYLCIVTEDNYQIYSFKYIDGWKLESKGWISGVRNLIPVEIDHELYLFAASTKKSALLKVAQYGKSYT